MTPAPLSTKELDDIAERARRGYPWVVRLDQVLRLVAAARELNDLRATTGIIRPIVD